MYTGQHSLWVQSWPRILMWVSKLCCSVSTCLTQQFICWCAGMSWDFWKVSSAELAHPRPGGVPPLVLWVIRLLNLVFNFLNLFWFFKMLKGAIKVRPVLCLVHCRLAGHPCVILYSAEPKHAGCRHHGCWKGGHASLEPGLEVAEADRLRAVRSLCLQVLTKGKQVLPVEPTAEAQVALTENSRKKSRRIHGALHGEHPS